MANNWKAQSGLEYLTTYGWAIFILVLVTALLWYMGAFNALNFLGPTTGAGGFSSFTHIDHKVNTSAATIFFVNSLSRRATITAATVGKLDDVQDTSCNAGFPLVVNANGNFTVGCATVPQGITPTVGASYDYIVAVNFTDSVSGNAHTDIGYISGRVEQ
ncbi:MAG: hypothetical protein V1835_01620 [Candidatus Micrarchaeota archaeon]